MRPLVFFAMVALTGFGWVLANPPSENPAGGSAVEECCAPVQSVPLASSATDWFNVGIDLGRAEEAARRDVAPRIISADLRSAMASRSIGIPTVQRQLESLLTDIEATDSPETVVSLVAAAKLDIARLASIDARSPSNPASATTYIASMWVGTWATTYGTMVLEQGEALGSLVGYYGSSEYLIRATVDSNNPGVIEGTWQEGSSTGRLRFALTDSVMWSGVWSSGDQEPTGANNWQASRVTSTTDLSNWIGRWETSYGDMHLKLADDGLRVVGFYGHPNKTIDAWIAPQDPKTLVGVWRYTDSGAIGRISFRMLDRDTWQGGWTGGDTQPSPHASNWHGKRKGDAQVPDLYGESEADSYGPFEAGSVVAFPLGSPE